MPPQPLSSSIGGKLLATLLLCTLWAAGPAQAQPVLRYRVNQRGDFTAIGNVLGHDCRTTAPAVPAPVVGTVGSCGFTLNDTAMDVFWRTDGTAAGTVANQTVAMTEASSQSMLVLPAGAQITYARLYWAATRESNSQGGPREPDTQVTLSRTGAGGFSVDLTADITWTSTRWPNQWDYQGSADVTRIIGQYGSGAYRISGVSVWPAINQFSDTSLAAWWLVVFYRVPTEPVRTLALYDDLLGLQFENTQITLGGFIIPWGAMDAKLGLVVYEGDIGEVGETFTLNGQTLSDANNPSNNFFNSTKSYLGNPVSQVGDLPQHLGTPHSVTGLDLDVADVTPYFSSNQTSATARLTATSDIIWLAGLPASITTLAPDFTNTVKTVRAVNPWPDGSIRVGDILEYTITTLNEGNEPSLNTRLMDPLPAQLQYVPGTLAITSGPNAGAKTDAVGDDEAEYDAATRTLTVRLGTGANAIQGGSIAVGESTSLTFQVQIVSSGSGSVSNQAFIRARGATNPHESTNPSTPTSGGTTGPTTTPIAVGPAAPVIITPAEGSSTRNRRVPMTGRADSNVMVTVRDEGGSTICTATADASGSWNCTPTADLPLGQNRITARAQDSGGNTSPTSPVRSFTVDTVVPGTPVIVMPAQNSRISTSRPPITGTAEPDSTVTVTEGGLTLCTATANASGSWACTPATALSEGPHGIVAAATDAAGNTSQPTPVRTFFVDTVVPTAPVITAPAEGSTTNDWRVPIAGTAEPETTVTVRDTGSNMICTATVNTSGGWSCTPTADLPLGQNRITARAQDSGGNTSPTSPVRSFTVDTVAPGTPVIVTPAQNSRISTSRQPITGTAEPDSTVTVTEGGLTLCTATANASGSWACTPAAALPRGLHGIIATAADAAGNTSQPTLIRTFFVDTVVPAAPVISTPAEGSTTNDRRAPIAGTAGPETTVTVRDGSGGAICTATTNASGSWSCTPAADLRPGLNQITAVARNDAGNTSPITPPRSFTVDVTPPNAPVLTNPNEGERVNSLTPVFAGTAEPGSTVTVSLGGGTACSTVTNASSRWSCESMIALLPGTTYGAIAVAQDAVGNTSPQSAPRSFTVDVSGPPAPVIITPAEGRRTNETGLRISGRAEPLSMVTVTESGTPLCTAVTDANGNWGCTPVAPLAGGPHAIVAVARDSVGHSLPTPRRNFIVDTTAPVPPVIITPAEGTTTRNSRQPLSGMAEASSLVTVTRGGSTLCTAVADTTGSWTCTPVAPLADGPHTIAAKATDEAGNTSLDMTVHNFFVFVDSDGDGIPDGLEPPDDTDGDGLPDVSDTDSDNDGIPDGLEDRNGSGSVDPGETDPRSADTDKDAILDGAEDRNRNGRVEVGETDPLNPDTDDDDLKDGQEDRNGNGTRDSGETDPLDPDTDKDGVTDGEEVNRGTDPLNGEGGEAPASCGCTSEGAAAPLLPLALLLASSLRRRQAE